MSVLENLTVYGFGTASIAAGVVYLFKQGFLHAIKRLEENHKSELRKREEDYKKELNKELKRIDAEFKELTDRQIEEHKSELKKVNDKYQIRFSKLHVDRAEAIKNLYGKMSDLELSIKRLLGLERTMDEELSKDEVKKKFDEANRKLDVLIEYYMINQIYFPEEVCETFNDLQSDSRWTLANFYSYYADGGEGNKETEKHQIERYINNEFPKIKRSLEIHFRRLLGVSGE